MHMEEKNNNIKVNIFYIYGELSKLEEMTKENVDNLYQNKNCCYSKFLPSILLSYGSFTEMPQTGWPKTTEVLFPLGLEPRSLKSKGEQGYASAEVSGTSLFSVSLPASAGYWLFLAFLATSLSSLLLRSLGIFASVFVCISVVRYPSSYKDTGHWIQGLSKSLEPHVFTDPFKQGHIYRFWVDMNL